MGWKQALYSARARSTNPRISSNLRTNIGTMYSLKLGKRLDITLLRPCFRGRTEAARTVRRGMSPSTTLFGLKNADMDS